MVLRLSGNWYICMILPDFWKKKGKWKQSYCLIYWFSPNGSNPALNIAIFLWKPILSPCFQSLHITTLIKTFFIRPIKPQKSIPPCYSTMYFIVTFLLLRINAWILRKLINHFYKQAVQSLPRLNYSLSKRVCFKLEENLIMKNYWHDVYVWHVREK